MKNLFYRSIFNPLKLVNAATFSFAFWAAAIPAIASLAGGALSSKGAKDSSEAQAKALEEQNAATAEQARLQYLYDKEATEEANRMSILQNLWSSGYFGGQEGDMNYGRTKLQRMRANSFGLLPESRKSMTPQEFLQARDQISEDPYMRYMDQDRRDINNFLDMLGVNLNPKEDKTQRQDYVDEWRRVREGGDPRDIEQWIFDHENPYTAPPSDPKKEKGSLYNFHKTALLGGNNKILKWAGL